MKRRGFLKAGLFTVIGVIRPTRLFASKREKETRLREAKSKVKVYRAEKGGPVGNTKKVFELMRGSGFFVNREDVVLIKPNGQWWNQGATSLSCMKAFVDEIFSMNGGFSGEVVIAENCHRGPEPWNSTGSAWASKFVRNSDITSCDNMSELASLLKKQYEDRFSLVHWINVSAGAKRVEGLDKEAGYVYCDGTNGTEELYFTNGLKGERARKTMATYPVFKTDRGTLVDFKHGVWDEGEYHKTRLKFINFAALNHHSTYAGMTSVIKNYMGITDLSGGPDPNNGGQLRPEVYNFHSFPLDKWAQGPVPGMLGAEIGFFMSKVRKADLNIVSAEWTGLSTRTELPAAKTQIVLASTDPVALDYHSAKYVLYPNSGIKFHDPDRKNGPLYQYLEACAEQTGDVLDESQVQVVSWDMEKDRLQEDNELVVHGEKHWGSDPKQLAKYALLRYFPFLLK